MKKALGLMLVATFFIAISCDQTNETINDVDNSIASSNVEQGVNNQLVSLNSADIGSADIDSEVSNANSEATAKPIHLTKAEFLKKVMNYEKNPNEWKFEGELPCLIDFYADWCGPCKQAAPILDELAKKYDGKINIYKIDTQTEQELAQAFGIKSIPAFLYCPKNGKPQMASGIGRSTEDTKQMFIKMIDEILLNNK